MSEKLHMLRHTKIAIVTFAHVVTGYAAYAAKARNSESYVLAAIGDNKFSLSQAITAAEASVGGKTLGVRL